MATKAVLITGATGKQGGSVVNALLKANAPFEILALTRNAQSESAQRLAKKSPKIKIVTGDLKSIDDAFAKAKEAASAPIWGVFSVQVPSKTEETEGKAIVDAALKAGVSHFIYTSVDRGGAASDTTPTNIPHFISKHNIEQHLFAKAKGSNMSWTVLRPVAFFENLTNNFFGKVFTSTWLYRLGEKDKKLQVVATSDIGVFAANAFLEPESATYKDKSISLAGDELTFDELKAKFQARTGETLPTTYEFIVAFINFMVKDLGYMFKWFRDYGYKADVEGLRRLHPGLKDFDAWLETESAWKKQ